MTPTPHTPREYSDAQSVTGPVSVGNAWCHMVAYVWDQRSQGSDDASRVYIWVVAVVEFDMETLESLVALVSKWYVSRQPGVPKRDAMAQIRKAGTSL